MTILKCKLCGGNIELTGQSHGICDSCGSEVTLPKIDDDKRADMYNRGNHFRRTGDFDRAYSAYQHIIADDRGDAEAHWCMTLCRYGVEYVKDARTGEYKPTISRMSQESILDDLDYLAALEASDDYTKEIYRREARKIEKIQRRYLEISRKEPAYDVFICFKAEETSGQRTKSSVLAQDIYENLTKKGLKVFFSRITLETKLSEEYEPYIFAALHSSKVMLLVADKPEQLRARWVQNEWSRYLSMMDRDSNKHLIPVYMDMSPYDFPSEIPTVQGQDMTKVGAMQDLVRGVCKITGHQAGAGASAPQGSAIVTDNLLKRVKQSMEDGAFDEAKRLLESVLNREPENGEAYYYSFLASNGWTKLPDEVPLRESLTSEDRYYRRALQYGSEGHKNELKAFGQACDEQYLLDLAERAVAGQQYKDAMEYMASLDELITLENLELRDESRYDRLWNVIDTHLKHKQEMTQYLEAIGDPDTYMKRMMEQRHPQELEEYKKKCKKIDGFHGFRPQHGKGGFPLLWSITALILSIIFVYLTVVLHMEFDLEENLFCSIFFFTWIIGGPVTIYLLFMEEFGILKIILAYLGVGMGVVGLMIPFSGALLILVSFLVAVISLVARFNCGRYEKLESERAIYRNRVLWELQDAIEKEVEDEWAPRVGKENLMKLTRI